MHDELRDALRQVDPPAGFAERVIAKANADGDARTAANVRLKADATKVWTWAVAATLVVAIGGGVAYRVDERRRGEEAKRQVLLSLNIAGSKLRALEIKVNNHQGDR